MSSASTSGAGTDANPTYVRPRHLLLGAHARGDSPVKGAPVSFPGITGGWGWPGFAMPADRDGAVVAARLLTPPCNHLSAPRGIPAHAWGPGHCAKSEVSAAVAALQTVH